MIEGRGTRVVVLGRGRWATKVRSMLERSAVDVVQVGSVRQSVGESDTEYVARISGQLVAHRATHAWLCVPPGPHVLLQVGAALQRGIHVIAEKPWPYGSAETGRAVRRGQRSGAGVSICFEYVLLSEVKEWRATLDGGAGLSFHGAFSIEGSDRLGIPPLWNMGSHLVAIREWAVPQTSLGLVRARYDARPERRVWLEDASGECVREIDFLGTRQPILERFAAGVMEGRAGVRELDEDFGLRVSEVVAALEPWSAQSTGSSP